jgi:hypothetical protein
MLSEIIGTFRRAIGDLLCTHYARPYTKFLTLPPVSKLGPQSLTEKELSEIASCDSFGFA